MVVFYFVQQTTKLENLPGYREDVKSLGNTFYQCGFDLRIFKNLSADGIIQTIIELTEEKDKANLTSILKGFASLVICILSHGGLDNTVYGTDGELVDIQKLQLVLEQCPELKGKPKVFIIQTHFRQQTQEEQKNDDSGFDDCPSTSTSSNRRAINVIPQNHDVVQLLCHSYVYPKYGTHFVQSLCYNLRFFSRGKLRDIYAACQAVRQEIAKGILTAGDCLSVNPTPILYSSTIESGMMVGIKTVPFDKRSKAIHYYCANNSDSSYQDFADFITTLKNSKPKLLFCKSKYSTDR